MILATLLFFCIYFHFRSKKKLFFLEWLTRYKLFQRVKTILSKTIIFCYAYNTLSTMNKFLLFTFCYHTYVLSVKSVPIYRTMSNVCFNFHNIGKCCLCKWGLNFKPLMYHCFKLIQKLIVLFSFQYGSFSIVFNWYRYLTQ